MERDLSHLSLNGRYDCNCSCKYCAAGQQYLAYLSSISGAPAFTTGLQPTDFSSASTFPAEFSSAVFQSGSLPLVSYGAVPEIISSGSFQPIGASSSSFQPPSVPSSGFQPTNLLSIDTLPADLPFADLSSVYLPLSNGLPNTITDPAAPVEPLLTAPAADTLSPPVSDDFRSPAIMVESVTLTRSNTHRCPVCQTLLATKASLVRHIEA